MKIKKGFNQHGVVVRIAFPNLPPRGFHDLLIAGKSSSRAQCAGDNCLLSWLVESDSRFMMRPARTSPEIAAVQEVKFCHRHWA